MAGSEHARVQEWFIRLLGLVYLIAFASFGWQANGLIGSHGIQPAAQYLIRVREALGGAAFFAAPSLLWINASDTAIRLVCAAGAICGLLAMAGLVWRAALVSAFVLYLSLVNASQEFLSYQWDYLLLEAGFLAIFLGYSPVVIWLFRWLLFRLMFFSGLVKLLSGDPTWRNLTALTFHYQTQPIPNPVAWYAHQLPFWFQELSCAGVFFIELLVPWLVLGPRRLRLLALPWLIGLQMLILLTGNYAFFNLLAIVLCVFLLDDAILPRWARRPLRAERLLVPARIRRIVAWSLCYLVGFLSVLLALESFRAAPANAHGILEMAAPFGIVNSYGLFANMTTTRPEIIIEGSNDGQEWKAYEFRYKPGRLDRAPPWVAPYQPRLDWQMWFAALGSYRENAWFVRFLGRLLEGRPEVLALMDGNPFPGAPPRFIRAQVEEYRFTDPETRRRTGNWWTRTPLGSYLRPISLADLAPAR